MYEYKERTANWVSKASGSGCDTDVEGLLEGRSVRKQKDSHRDTAGIQEALYNS